MVFAFGVKQIIQREITQGGDLIFIPRDLIGLKALRYDVIDLYHFCPARLASGTSAENDFRAGEWYYRTFLGVDKYV